MKKGELIDKGIATLLTLAFMAVVRPDPAPSGVAWGLMTILFFVFLEYSIRYMRREKRRQRARRNLRAMHYDGRRWADEWLYWPLKEVS